LSENSEPHEAGLLALDASLAAQTLGWKGKLGFEQSIKWTTDWYQQVNQGSGESETTLKQIETFINL
jgi:CDP-glucose 4,6-dehydratase